MILRVIFFSTSPEDYAKGKKIWDDEMVPLLRQQKGFRKAYRAEASDEPGGGVVVQVWDSKVEEEAWRSHPDYQKVVRKLEPLLPELRIERDFVVTKEI